MASDLVGKIQQLTQHASTNEAKVLIDAAALVQEAVEAERERIASMVEAVADSRELVQGQQICAGCAKTIAAMIREQGNG
jgi:hypothetical protein